MYWYEDEIKHLEEYNLNLAYAPETIFYGSSSIRLWSSMQEDFKDFKPVNLGFGGSTLAACDWFFERIISPYRPRRLVIYAGDNDLGDGRHPEEVFIFFRQLVVTANKQLGNLPCYFISLKPSINRWHLADNFKYANSLIEKEITAYSNNWRYIDIFKKMMDDAGQPNKEFYVNDGLHLSEKGYQLWTAIIKEHITREG